MKIALDRFRSFGEAQEADLAPITFLVGENSTGKTSFMAGLRYILDFAGYNDEPSFNKAPFYLGSYKDIAHYRGGKYGRASEFHLRISDTADVSRLRRGRTSTNKLEPVDFSLDVTFTDLLGEALPSSIALSFDDTTIRVKKLGDSIVTSVNKRKSLLLTHTSTFTGPFERGVSMYALENLAYRIIRNRSEPDLFSDADEKHNTDALQDIARKADIVTTFLVRQYYDVVTLPPVRTKPERHYDPLKLSERSEGDELIALLGSTIRSKPGEWQKLQQSLEEYGIASGLFTNISVKKLGNADSDPFRIQIRSSGRESNIMDVGYGISQALPLFIMLAKLRDRSVLLLQQPEVHLHPSSQAALGNVLAQAHVGRLRNKFIVETHSDYLIDRIRLLVRDGLIKPQNVRVLFFSRHGHNSLISKISVDKNGDYISLPDGYRDFFINESMKVAGF